MKKNEVSRRNLSRMAEPKKQGLCVNVGLFSKYSSRGWKLLFWPTFHWISGGFQYQPGSFQPSRLQCFLGQEFLADCGVCQRAPAHAAPQAWLVLTDVRHVTVWLEFQHQQQMIESLCFGGVGPVAGGCLNPAWDWPVLQTLLFLRSLIMRFVSQI